jgi:hypothetical protein
MNHKFLSVFFCNLFIFSACCLSAPPPPGPYDTLKTKTGAVVKCSPDGKAEGSLPPGEAIRNLKKGSILHLLPGHYSSSFDIDNDGLIIEGEPGGYCAAGITVKGKKAIIRNLWIDNVNCNTDLTVIDSVISNYNCRTNEKKMEQVFYNSCFNNIQIDSCRDNKLNFTKCTVVSDSSHAVSFSWGDTNISFSNCILSGKNKLFRLPELDRSNKQGVKISLDNTLLYGEMALADGIDKSGVNSRGKEETVRDMKGLKRLTKQLVTKGEVITEKPMFKKERNANTLEKSTAVTTGSSSCTNYYIPDLNMFVLEDESPGKDRNIGATLSDEVFQIREQPKDANKPATPPPPPRAAPDSAPEAKPPKEGKSAKQDEIEEANLNEIGIPAP